MKSLKSFSVLFLLCALIAGLAACSKKPKEEQAAEERAKSFLPDNSPASQKKTNIALVDASTCMKDDDCVAVFPSCCQEANPPFYVNKLYKDEFIAHYRKYNKEETCPVPPKCPISYFGLATATKCLKNICVEGMRLADTIKEPVMPIALKEKQVKAEAVKEWNQNQAELAKEKGEEPPTPLTVEQVNAAQEKALKEHKAEEKKHPAPVKEAVAAAPARAAVAAPANAAVAAPARKTAAEPVLKNAQTTTQAVANKKAQEQTAVKADEKTKAAVEEKK